MSVYTEHFSKRDAYKRYNLNKIQYDVFNYDLKNKLIFDDFNTFSYHNCIHTKGYGAEEIIINRICAKKKMSPDLIHPCIPDISGVELRDFCADRYRHELNGNTELLCKNNDLYLNMELLVLATAYDDIVNTMLSKTTKTVNTVLTPAQKEGIIEFLDGSETLNAILQLECALSRKESLVPNLGWLLTEYKDKHTLSEFDDLENIKNEYKSGRIPYMFNYSLTNNYMPIHIVDPCHHKSDSTFIKSSFLNNEEYCKLTTPTKDVLISMQYRKVLIYGIEILNAIETIKNEKLRNILYDLFIKDLETHPGKCLFIKDYLYKKNNVSGELEINKKVKDIIDIKDMSERFKAILEYSNNVTSYPNYTTFEAGFEYVPMFLSFFVQYCNDTSFKSIRIKIALFLLEEMKALGITLDSRSSEHVSKGFAGMGFNMDDTSNDLFKTSYTEHSETESIKDENPSKAFAKKVEKTASVNEILDRKVSEFTENMYDFNVKNTDSSLKNETAKDSYNNILKSVNLVSKNLTKQIKDIKTYNEGGKNGSLSKGKLDKKNIHRYKYDKNIFYNNTYKIKESDLAFGILLDISGSMHGTGIENGRITMIILHEVLKTLGINHCIATHNSRNQHQCNITKYVQFKENANHSIGKCYDLATISASGGNCDSGALYYMEKELLRTTNKDKICLIFSDGEPTECTGTELRDQVKHMEKEGIKVIGIGINFDSIKDYYLDYANGRTLKEMLNIVAGILKQYVLDKKD